MTRDDLPAPEQHILFRAIRAAAYWVLAVVLPLFWMVTIHIMTDIGVGMTSRVDLIITRFGMVIPVVSMGLLVLGWAEVVGLNRVSHALRGGTRKLASFFSRGEEA